MEWPQYGFTASVLPLSAYPISCAECDTPPPFYLVSIASSVPVIFIGGDQQITLFMCSYYFFRLFTNNIQFYIYINRYIDNY